ncbi:cation-transporting P-type ATPase [bacterium]|nr:cation-transporting P-type ATPase [bacterium]
MPKELFQRTIEELKDNYKTDIVSGLTQEQAQERLTKYGRNVLEEGEGVSPLKILFNQFKSLIVLLLLAAAVVSFLIGEQIEGVAVAVVIILNAAFGFITEFRAEKAIDGLRKMIPSTAKVIRNGELINIDSALVVPGDILFVEEGDRITADIRLFEADNMFADEAILTGESEPVEKHNILIGSSETPLAERVNMLFTGTALTRGNGTGIVVATGMETQMGQISHLLSTTEDETTPLEKKLAALGRALVVITLVVAGIVALTGILLGKPLVDMLKTAIALAIAAVPEGLPAVATITLAIGMGKMAKKNALVKSLPAVETLGSTTVICTDKTGTLTENQMTLKKAALFQKTYDITGTGYDPKGDYLLSGKKIAVESDPVLTEFLQLGALCSNAAISENEGDWSVVGDPTEGALLSAAAKAGFDHAYFEQARFERSGEIPFSSEAKYMAVSVEHNGTKRLMVKGAPGIVLDMCSHIRTAEGDIPLDEDKKALLMEKNRALAGEGLRILSLAVKDNTSINSLSVTTPSGLVFLGFAGILDPPRPDVAAAISEIAAAGIRTIMITGDQKETALSIARQIGLAGQDDTAVSGNELDTMSGAVLLETIRKHSVFYRVSPKNKLDIVGSLNDAGEITAMTGDGVNDSPALKRASIGIAMGQRGTAVAQEASDMVLLDDKFTTIVSAIKHGRVIFVNIEKFIHYLFSCNLSEILFIFIGILMKLPTPLLALQILWLNLITDVFPALALGWEVPENDVLAQKPRKLSKKILSGEFKRKIGIHAVIITLGPLFIYLMALRNSSIDLAQARTMGFLAIAFVQLLHVFNVRRKNGLGLDRTLLKNPYVWGAFAITVSLQIFAVYAPFMRRVLHTSLLSGEMWLWVLFGSVAPVVLIQLWSLAKKIMLQWKPQEIEA